MEIKPNENELKLQDTLHKPQMQVKWMKQNDDNNNNNNKNNEDEIKKNIPREKRQLNKRKRK